MQRPFGLKMIGTMSIWLVRHIKAKQLPGDFSFVARRKRHVGKAICVGEEETAQGGITVSGDSLLPFLLAARASAQSPETRPVFAEGLASSYEAYLKTRQVQTESATGTDSTVDGDDDSAPIPEVGGHSADD